MEAHNVGGSEFANRFAQLMVREGVHVAFLQRCKRILDTPMMSDSDVLSTTRGIVDEWEGWHKSVQA